MKVLVVVDMQNDFVTGALGTPEARAIVPNVVEKVKKYAVDPNCAIVFTRDTHYSDYMETLEGKNLPVPHCMIFTNGWEIVPEVWGAAEGCEYLDTCNKTTFGAFTLGDEIDEFIQTNEMSPIVESIEVVGVCTDICVVSNVLVLKSFFENIPITVDSACCAGVTPAKHEAAIEVMKSCQIEVI